MRAVADPRQAPHRVAWRHAPGGGASGLRGEAGARSRSAAGVEGRTMSSGEKGGSAGAEPTDPAIACSPASDTAAIPPPRERARRVRPRPSALSRAFDASTPPGREPAKASDA